MSLVPFASSTPVAAQPVAPRPAAPASTRAVGGGPSPAASSRSQAVAREDGRGAHHTKGRQGFASVLAAVRDQEPHETASRAPDARPSSVPTSTTESARPTRKDVDGDERSVQGHDTRPAPQAEPQTPWLLLALGAGPWAEIVDTSSDGDAASSAEGQGDAPSLTSGVGPASGDLGVGTALVGAVPAAAPIAEVVAPGTEPLQSPAGTAASLPATSAAIGTALESMGPGGALETEASAEGAEATAMRAAAETVAAGAAAVADATSSGTVPVDDVTDPSAAEVATAETLARWRAAGRGGDESAGSGAASGPARDAGVVRPATPGTTVNRLAQALGKAVGAQGDAPTTPVPAVAAAPVETGGQAPAAVAPSARATEVLQRLAQGVPPASRKSAESLASGAFAQMLSSAMPSAPDVPAASAPPPAAPLPATVGEQVLTQVVSSLKVQWKDGVGEAKLHLRPDALGNVSVILKVEAGAVTAVVKADNPQVQEWILQHQPSLRQQMEAAGLTLDELVVSPDDQGQSGGQAQQEPEDTRRRSGRKDDDTRPDGRLFETLL